ncbi:unnamed protein product [Trifolium pratense]|uniref:Uncharacterized protein n=1 Tax=Trifolium pratense TaxID=57577 RepID=A0ACB0J752_TRIPR|nr:unnamed protein product [Trifolium pratense]
MTKCSSSSTQKSFAGEKGRKRGLSPEYKLRWIEKHKTRRSGWVDVLYIHKYVPNLICRSIRAVQMYEKYGTLPRGN